MSPTRHRIFQRFCPKEMTIDSTKLKNSKLIGLKRPSTTHLFTQKLIIFKSNLFGFFFILYLLINSINVTIGSVHSDDWRETNLNLKKLFNGNSLEKNDSTTSFKLLYEFGVPENDFESSNVNSTSSYVVEVATTLKDFKKSKSSNDDVKGRRQNMEKKSLATKPDADILPEIGSKHGPKHRTRRKRRYVRFPPGEGWRFSGKFHSRPFHSGTPLIGAYSSGFSPWGPIARPSFYSHVPTMRPRSPRLVFRDVVEPGTLSAPSGFFGGGLQDIDFDDDREERGGKGTHAGTEDKGVCTNGKCEFFVSCWMSSGLIDGSCGGFLYACCHRADKEAPKTNEHRTNDVITLPTNFGPVVNDFRCGVSIGKIGAQRRIVGGDEAGFGSFPWQAYIRIGSSRCGGSLVNRFHVVTAGHCVARASARQVQVTLGDYVINSAIEPLPAYTFGVREIRVHPYFKFTPQADRFDVAVLRLDRPVQYMPHIAPICLPEKNENFLGQYGWAAGWGALQAGSRLRPKTLQAVDVPVIDNRQCERWHKSNGINVVIYDEMMCAGYRNGGKDSCQGDSGGPLMMEKANRWYLIGIVSAGYSCAQRGQPGIYHRVAHTVDWISYIINS